TPLQLDELDEMTGGRIVRILRSEPSRETDSHSLSADAVQLLIDHADLALLAAWMAKERIVKLTLKVKDSKGSDHNLALEYKEKPLLNGKDIFAWLSNIISTPSKDEPENIIP